MAGGWFMDGVGFRSVSKCQNEEKKCYLSEKNWKKKKTEEEEDKKRTISKYMQKPILI